MFSEILRDAGLPAPTAERRSGQFQKVSRADKSVAVALIPAIAGQFVFIGLSFVVGPRPFHRGVLDHPRRHANAFAMTLVRHQEERGQVVSAGGLQAIVLIVLFVLRIAIEKGLLRRELPGHAAFPSTYCPLDPFSLAVLARHLVV